ncbi:cell division protein SepF [Dermatophilus congolensis]|uniref:Cell division protein SepF n=1 Tax=Dermatophilus congolensis TaxID=1863 RepID=A0AA46BM15_9MICO|nr:cell division protein SepF [Dermatophilus congolensis]STD06075.1 Cell division protein SepF [Dermatophilus congolensis]
MAGALHKAMVYLGLTDEVDRYDEEYANGYRRATDGAADGRDHRSRGHHAASAVSDREAQGDEWGASQADAPTPIRRSAPVSSAAAVAQEDVHDSEEYHAEVAQFPRRVPVSEVVDDVEVMGVHRITTIHPRTYNEAKKVGEAFRDGTPVIMNLSDLDDADAKRLVDFAAGLVFGLAGSIERVTNKVFLLSPSDVEVTTTSEVEDGGAHAGVFDQH